MIRSVLLFSILPARRDEFLAGFERLEVLRRASVQPGWLDNPIRAEIQAELGPLLAADPVPRVYEVVEDVGPWEDET